MKAIAADKGGQAILKTANVGKDAGVVEGNDRDAFIATARLPDGLLDGDVLPA